MTAPIRLVLADDQELVRLGFRMVLDAQEDMTVVAEVSNGRDALARATTGPGCDVILMDIRMPIMDGVEATRRIVASGSNTKVLVLTTFDLDAYVYEAIRAGASGFLLKDVTAERLVEGVRLVAEGSMLLGPAVTRRLVDDFAARGAAQPDADLAPLSPREREVLRGLARGRSNAEIAADLVVAPETVKSHVAEVLRKLSLRDRIQAVVWAYEHGLVRPGG